MVAKNNTYITSFASRFRLLIARAVAGGLSIDNIAKTFDLEKEIVEELILDAAFHATVLQLKACKRYQLVERLGDELEKNIEKLISIRDCDVFANATDKIRACKELTCMYQMLKQEMDVYPRLAALEGKISRSDINTYINEKLEEYSEGIDSTKLNELNEKLSLYGV